jgi:hypothetical protein
MHDAADAGNDIGRPLSTKEALAAIEEQTKTLKRIAALEARWAAHTDAIFTRGMLKPLPVGEALALLAEHREAKELCATQKALWHLHIESTFGPSTVRPEPMKDPQIAIYYQSLDRSRETGNPKAIRKAREKRAWALLRDKLTAADPGRNKAEAAVRKPSKRSNLINETKGEAMSKEEAVNPAAGTAARPASKFGKSGPDAPMFDWGDPSPNAADLAAADNAKAGTSEWADARIDLRKQGMKEQPHQSPAAQAELQANRAIAGSLTEQQELIEATMLKRIVDTAEGMSSAPLGAVPGDETMVLVVAEDLKALAAIQTPELRERALWVMAESRQAQPAYDAEIYLRATPEFHEDMAVAVKARGAGLAAAEARDQALREGTPMVENTIAPAPAASQQPGVVSPDDLTRLSIPVSTANLLTSLPVDDITPDRAAELVHEDIGALNGIEDAGTRKRALDAIAESSRAQPRYKAQLELELQVPELAAEVGAAAPDNQAAAPAVENTIEPAPAVMLGDRQKHAQGEAGTDSGPELDSAALEAVAGARTRDRETVAKMMGWNTIERSQAVENKPLGQVLESAPTVAAPAAPEAVLMVVPEEVERAYLHVGNRFYMPKNRDRVAFEDHGDKLKTALSVAPVTLAMVQIAQARGWTSIKVDGTPEFRKEAWREASLRGIGVEGYKPTELDLADLARRMPKKAPENQVAAMATATAAPAPTPAAPGGIYISAADAALLAMAKAAWAAPAPVAPAAAPAPAAAAVPAAPGAAVPPGDKLVAHGPAKYQHDQNNPASYFAVLENAQGKQRTVWGVKLGEAIAKAGVGVGDQVALFKNGEEQVTVDANVKDDAGKVVGTRKIGATRNEWTVKAHAFAALPPSQAVQQHPDLAGAFGAATKLGLQARADGFSPAALDIIAARQQENIGKAIARGDLPKADLKEKVEAKRSAQQEMAP